MPKISFLLAWTVGCIMGTTLFPMQSLAQTNGDARKGAALFASHCAECHSMKDGKHKKGPSLFLTIGTKAGQQPGFSYSEAMKDSNLTWTAESLARYITNPKVALPGGKMKYDGMDAASERTDLIAYLAVQGKLP